MKKRRRARPVNPADFDRNSLIERSKAVRLIAQEIEGTDDPCRRTLNAVSHRITDAVNNGKLKIESFGRFRFGELVRFAQDTFPGHFTLLPVIRDHVISPGTGVGRLPPISGKGTGRVLHASALDDWRDYAIRLEAEHSKLRDAYLSMFFENDAHRQEIESLRTHMLRAEQTREKKRQAGKKGGRGRSWEKSE